MLDLNRLVWRPEVVMTGQTLFIADGLEQAIEVSDATDAAETAGTPLNDLTAAVYGTGESTGGNGDLIAEFAGRQCYRSWMKGRPTREYIANVIAMGHGSVFEHAAIVFQITGVSRALTHELIRHRVGTAFSQESQRYVDAKDIRFVVPPLLAYAVERQLPPGFDLTKLGEMEPANAWANLFDTLDQDTHEALALFTDSCQRALNDYINLQGRLERLAKEAERLFQAGDVKAATSAKKRANEAARSLLPNAAETRMLFTCNLRELRHLLTLRGDEPADLEIRRFAVQMLGAARSYAPAFFDDLSETTGSDGIAKIKNDWSRV